MHAEDRIMCEIHSNFTWKVFQTVTFWGNSFINRPTKKIINFILDLFLQGRYLLISFICYFFVKHNLGYDFARQNCVTFREAHKGVGHQCHNQTGLIWAMSQPKRIIRDNGRDE
jgi:hypothetical protein